MNEELQENPFHPAAWRSRRDEDGKAVWPPPGLSREWQAWLVWFGDAIACGGFTSLGQTCREVLTSDGSGREISRRQLHVDQSTMSRWLNGVGLANEESLRLVMGCLNERIKERRQTSGEDAPALITDGEVCEGLRLLSTARAARDAKEQPAQRAVEEWDAVLAEVFGELGKVRALRDRLAGQVEEARTSAVLVQRVRTVVRDAEDLRKDLEEALRRVRDLEERLEKAERVLVNWQDRYDRLRAEYEMACEAARTERLAMQDELSELRATVWLLQQSERDPQAPASDARDHDGGADEDDGKWVEEVAQQLIALRDRRRERDQVLRAVCADPSRKGIYLLALRLGEEPGVGPGLAQELMRRAGVRYYDPWLGEPSALRQWWADMMRTRLEPRPRVPRTALPHDSDSVNPFHLGDGTQI